MSQKARKRKAKVKKVTFKDKNWYPVIGPKSFNFREIGEIIGLPNNLVGRTLEILLYDITDDYSDISLKLRFKIVDIDSEKGVCNSVFWGHQYTNDYVRSLIGRGSSKVQVIINLFTKDNWGFRLTTICTTIRRARSSQQIVIRKIIMEILREFAKNLNHEKFINGIIYHEFENQINRVAKTIYPLSNCTIIKSKIFSIPEGGEDKVYISKEEEFDIVEVDVKRTRKSEIRRTERINVAKLAKTKTSTATGSESQSNDSETEE
ncbi:MAG: 30S ribosomal protein S3ae [Candidatus Hodarchaeota archaeon]